MARKTTTCLLAGCIYALLWFAAPEVHGSPAEPAVDLALWVARVSANEGALYSRPEAALVWQTTRSSAKTTEKRAVWLSKHSPRVHGTRVCRSGNCFWSPNLTRDLALPAGLNMRLDHWELRVAPYWRDLLAYVDWMVAGDRKSEDPCQITPKTWGCPADRAGALARGLYPILCRGKRGKPLDDGFTYGKHCWTGSGGWGCDPSVEPSIQSDAGPLDMSLASRLVTRH